MGTEWRKLLNGRPTVLLSVGYESLTEYFQQWFGDGVVVLRPYHQFLDSTRAPTLTSSAEQAGALFAEWEEIVHASGLDASWHSIIDLSSLLAQYGFADLVSQSYPMVKLLSPMSRGVALETSRDYGQRRLASVVAGMPAPVLTVPEHEVLLEPPNDWDEDTLGRKYGPHFVLKQEAGMEMFRVRFAKSEEEFDYLLSDMLYPLQIQRYVEGIEIAFYVMVVGMDAAIVPLATLFEHKRALTGDYGALTGEMGTLVLEYISPHAELLFERLRPLLTESGYTGPLEINTRYNPETKEWVFLEFTCRQSDPGWQILSGMFVQERMQATWESWLRGDPMRPFYRQPCAVGVCLAGAGYPHPNGCIQDIPITVHPLPEALVGKARIEPFNVSFEEDRWFTSGGRHVLVTGHGNTVGDARANAYAAASCVEFFGRQYRTDIAAQWESSKDALIAARLLSADALRY